jgi:hypothetical protein
VGEGSDQPDGYAYAYVLTDEEAAKVKETPPDLAPLVCSFCGRSREQVPRLLSGRGVTDPDTGAILAPVYICNQCVAACAEASATRRTGNPVGPCWVAADR